MRRHAGVTRARATARAATREARPGGAWLLAALAGAALASLLATELGAQQRRPARRQAPIEIRGQVPTPQVVTVRPREVPAYNRQFLVPAFYDHDFWPVIVMGYQLVNHRLLTGNARLDSLARTDSARMADSTRLATHGRAAIGIGLFMPRATAMPGAPGTPGMPASPGGTTPPRTPADTTRGTTGGAAQQGGTPPASGMR